MTSKYGAFFYLIIGTHAIHAIGAVIGEKIVSQVGKRDSQAGNLPSCSIVSFFVVGVYLSLCVDVSELGKEVIDEEATGTIVIPAISSESFACSVQ